MQLILDDFLSEMDFSEALTLGALIASYTRQAFDINIALSAIGLYWKLADYTLITARGTRSLRILCSEAQPGERPEIVRKMRQEIIVTILPTCMDNVVPRGWCDVATEHPQHVDPDALPDFGAAARRLHF